MQRLLMAALLLGGCAETHYLPQVVARGELTLTNRHGLQMNAGGQRIARSITWKGLTRFVDCVPEARTHALFAERNGRASLAFAVVGGTLGAVALGGLVGLADQQNRWTWLGSGIGAGALGAIFAGLSRSFRNHANGHAVDALNLYNDAVGSLGARCDDLRYPPSAGPAPTP